MTCLVAVQAARAPAFLGQGDDSSSSRRRPPRDPKAVAELCVSVCVRDQRYASSDQMRCLLQVHAACACSCASTGASSALALDCHLAFCLGALLMGCQRSPQLLAIEQLKLDPLAHHSNRCVLRVQRLVALHTRRQSAKCVLDELVLRAVIKTGRRCSSSRCSSVLGEAALEVRLGRLRASTNGHRLVLEVVAGRLSLEQVRAGNLIVACDQETNTIRPPHVRLRALLVLVCKVVHQPRSLHGRLVHKLVVQALHPKPLAKHERVRGQARDRDPHVVVDAEELLLI
mmetsp:Transcript_13936/g.44688  ORF Transcript_13936/g.44688 Transcript_13936/m.44688 type:complete len:286 (+) Transcript_13936:560-1417(+)